MDQSDMGCCSCFGFLRKPHTPLLQFRDSDSFLSNDLLVSQHDGEDPNASFYGGQDTNFLYQSDNGPQRPVKRSQEIIMSRAQSGFVCRQAPVKETKKAICREDENGNKMVNQYIHQRKIGSGSYGKVVLYSNTEDGKLYAVKVLHKSYMKKVRVAPSETAMSDVLREASNIYSILYPKSDRIACQLNSTHSVASCPAFMTRFTSRKGLFMCLCSYGLSCHPIALVNCI